MLRQREALEVLKGVEVASVKVGGGIKHLHSFTIATTDSGLIVVCTFDNHLVVEYFTPSEVRNLEWRTK